MMEKVAKEPDTKVAAPLVLDMEMSLRELTKTTMDVSMGNYFR